MAYSYHNGMQGARACVRKSGRWSCAISLIRLSTPPPKINETQRINEIGLAWRLPEKLLAGFRETPTIFAAAGSLPGV
jgi:hypothetical protein